MASYSVWDHFFKKLQYRFLNDPINTVSLRLQLLGDYCLGKVLNNSARRYQQHNVGGLHELQRRELCEWHFAIRHDCRWQYRKLVVHVWGDLYNHEESPGPRKSIIWHGQSNSELASAGESGQTLTKYVISNRN